MAPSTRIDGKDFREPMKEAEKGVARAQRFMIHTPIRFRHPGCEAWHSGMTENISDSGVLFSTSEALPPRTRLEMQFVPVEGKVMGELPAEVQCKGEVVRIVPASTAASASVLAAKIDYYRLVRRKVAGEDAVH